MQNPSDQTCLSQAQQHVLKLIFESQDGNRVLPHVTTIQKASSSLISSLPDQGHGIQRTTEHVLEEITPALNHQALSPSYYGFVTGGVTPAARLAEEIVSAYDQNVAVHLPETSIATTVEDHALKLLLQLFNFNLEAWPGRTFTTGATASNVMGLACGREHIINGAIQKRRKHSASQTAQTVGELGLLAACREADIADIQILTNLPHSSLKKASSIVGLGRSCLHQVSRSKDGLEFDLDMLEERLKRPYSASIVVISCAEVNTGLFATHSYGDVDALRALCDKYDAWLHVDAAFGLFARILESSEEFAYVHGGAEGLELADSIAGDAHKLLNVPYDCGFFFCRHPGQTQRVFQNANAAYLSAGSPSLDHIESPLNVGIENSRRFRALPVYSTLVSYGRRGYQDMLQSQIRFARRVAWYISQHPDLELLPQALSDKASIDRETYIIVLFRAKNEALNHTLVKCINDSCQIYVTGTSWNEVPACRIAAANWQVDPERDAARVGSVLERVLRDWRPAH
ncbi:MAG: hypothetical protein Q9177_002571 [Variospora cf. flavescens]